jgi:hypothetical protein
MPSGRDCISTIQPRAGDGAPRGAATSVAWFSSMGSLPSAMLAAITAAGSASV